MESAVAREVQKEEIGVNGNHHSTKYISSQAWPFSQSCMIGFYVKERFSRWTLALINIDPNELVDAQWFEFEKEDGHGYDGSCIG